MQILEVENEKFGIKDVYLKFLEIEKERENTEKVLITINGQEREQAEIETQFRLNSIQVREKYR